MGTLAWMRNNSKNVSKSGIDSNFRSSGVEGQKSDSDLLDAAKELENRLTDREKLVVLAIAHEKAEEVITPRIKLKLTNLFDIADLKKSFKKCSQVVDEVCSKYMIANEDLHDYLFLNNFPSPIEPI
jgi:hypothetical protein